MDTDAAQRVNRETLLDAQKNPQDHQDLIVRVWGWSGHFVQLDKGYQDPDHSAYQLSGGIVYDKSTLYFASACKGSKIAGWTLSARIQQ